MALDRQETARTLMDSFKRLHHTLHKSVFKTLGKDLKPSPLMVMMHLLRAAKQGNPDGLRVSEIAASMGISVPGVTQIITGLEKEKYVRREMDPEDRRAVLVSLTDTGRRIMKPAFQQIEENFFGLIDRLGEENSRILVKLLIEVEEYFNE